MNYQTQTREQLLLEVHKLQEQVMTLQTLYENEISEHKKVVNAFRKTEDRFQSLFDGAPMGYQSLDEDGFFIDVNQEWLRTFGYKREEVIGKSFGKFLAPEFVDAFRERFLFFKSQGKIHSEFQMIKKDGSRCFIAFEGRIEYKENGDFKQTHCILSDITVRKIMEQTLMESEEKYRLIFEGTSEGILLIDIETRLCSYSNTSFCRMFGYSEKEIDKLRIEDLHPKEALGNVLSKLDSHKRGKNTKSQACPCLRKDGTIFYSDISGDCAIINGRKHSVKFFTDVNERKQTEAELKTLLNTSMDGYYLVDTEGHFLDTNDAYCSMIGYTRDEILKMAIKDVEALETEDVIKNRINRILETGYDRFETKHRCKNGRIIDIEASVNLLIIGQPKLFNFMRDITERKIAEAALQKEKNELKKLNNLFVDRELKMINLKKEINELLKEEGIKEKYVIHS